MILSFYCFTVDIAYGRKGFVWFKAQFSNCISFTSPGDFTSSTVRSLKLLTGVLFLIPSFLTCRCFLKMLAFISHQLIVTGATVTSGSPLPMMHLWRTGMNA